LSVIEAGEDSFEVIVQEALDTAKKNEEKSFRVLGLAFSTSGEEDKKLIDYLVL